MAQTRKQAAASKRDTAHAIEAGGRAATAQDRESGRHGNARREITKRAGDPNNTGRNR